MMRVAIIGAGLSGLLLANALKEKMCVTLFEKARGVGGRMSTRRADPFSFDHGAPFFTACTPAFRAFLAPFMQAGVVAPWQGRFIGLDADGGGESDLDDGTRLVGTPRMNGLCKALSQGLDVRLSCEVAPLQKRHANQWHLASAQGDPLGAFDWVISSAPAPQTQRLFGATGVPPATLAPPPMAGCFSLMLGTHTPWARDWAGARLQNDPLSWISCDSTKPGRRRDVTSIVAQAHGAWVKAHLDEDLARVEAHMIEATCRVLSIAHGDIVHRSLHRWRYAFAEDAQNQDAFLDAALGLACTGEQTRTGGVEALWHSAQNLGHQIAAHIT